MKLITDQTYWGTMEKAGYQFSAEIKKTGKRWFYYSKLAMRWLPIAKANILEIEAI